MIIISRGEKALACPIFKFDDDARYCCHATQNTVSSYDRLSSFNSISFLGLGHHKYNCCCCKSSFPLPNTMSTSFNCLEGEENQCAQQAPTNCCELESTSGGGGLEESTLGAPTTCTRRFWKKKEEDKVGVKLKHFPNTQI